MNPNPSRKNKTASLEYECDYMAQGYTAIIGMDEAGRGPWAGPVYAGAVALPLERTDLSDALKGVRDSKQMTANQRERLTDIIKNTARAWGVGVGTVQEITELGIMGALRLAFQRALGQAKNQFNFAPDYLFLDYVKLKDSQVPQLNLKKGDSLSLSIACASVLAKTARDKVMCDLAIQYPMYGFEHHKGYGTAEHLSAIEKWGILQGIHRSNFSPIMAHMDKLLS
jgi:ribonuclease HII